MEDESEFVRDDDNVNVICWGYAYGDPAMSVFQDGKNPLQEIDLVFEQQYDWSTSDEPEEDHYDVQNVATHEVGHWLNLGDLEYGTQLTMYERLNYIEEQMKRTLEQDDINGIRHIYKTVRVPTDYSFINDALDAAKSGQTVLVSSGTRYADDDMIIESDITLEIEYGTTVKIPAGKRLQVYGILKADGTPGGGGSGDNITFEKSASSSWYGIRFENSSDEYESILKNCTIKDASYGVYCYNASPDIEDCTIINNIYGIYSKYSGTLQVIKYNEVSSNSSYGITLYGSSSLVDENEIKSNTRGICGVQADSYAKIIDNDIHDNTWDGIFLSDSDPYMYKNIIYDNSRNGVRCYNYSNPYLICYFLLIFLSIIL